MMTKLIAAMIATLATGTAPVPPVPLAPIGGWTVNGDADGMCTLTRDYGAAADPVTIGFQAWPTRPTIGVLLLTKSNAGVSRGFGRDHDNPGRDAR